MVIGIDARNFELSWYVTDPETNKQTQPQFPQTHNLTGPITIHSAAKLSAQCNDDA